MPPHRCLIMRRLARAKDLLAATGMTLPEIATVRGLTDQSYFTRIRGPKPGRWRRERKL
jgi:AraC-like DNA-binding protein